ncbi:YjbH domain-containing protein [Deefgea tanakiae]|uniref:YjbH domain-containing protein n=1 Tax=Deefgea tanakiae TaxID=2865840 RepID=A0ABX8Z6W2_9NEIS|nr:YjbH domain-containing protein [Deefgea tanakiae]QZA78303.1 YjbH domain-containing protein [Deefgea tanakiae]
MTKTRKTLALTPVVSLLWSSGLFAQNSIELIGPTQSDFGGVGLMQMPTARMAAEGEFSLNLMDNSEYRRYSLSAQILPWLETTLRYTDIRTRLYSNDPSFSGDQSLKDKGADVKVRLLKESYYSPEVSLGFRDIAGTGLFDGEFVAASKRFGPVDLTLGLGWGYLAKSGNVANPFCQVRDSFCTRQGGFTGSSGGQTNFGRFFKGESAIFGGVEYQTPWHPLRFKLEYDGNNYQGEVAGSISQKSSLNVGAVYRIKDHFDAHLSYQRGNALMFGLTMRTNMNDIKPLFSRSNPEVYAPNVSAEMDQEAWDKLANKLSQNSGYVNPELRLDSDKLIVIADQTKFSDREEAVKRASVSLANAAPKSAKEFHLVEEKNGLLIAESIVDRKSIDIEHQPKVLGIPEQKTEIVFSNPEEKKGTVVREPVQQSFSYFFKPSLTQSFGGPEAFYMYQVGVDAVGELKINKNWLATGVVYFNIYDNYDDFNFKGQPSNGGETLPPVRTLIREYVSNSPVRINNLQLTRFDQFGSSFYSQVYGGYLEMMYAGVGGEVLYRPLNSSWAVGLDMNWVKQRDPSDQFGFIDYETVTGHLTGYAKAPYLDNVWLSVSAGRYLAKDYGVTISIAKEFDSGIRAGFFATKTNVSAEEYGEGAFTKGVYISIPFDLFTATPTRNRGAISWLPLTRDGGQALARKFSLHGMTESRADYD